jgi:glyoxylase I family protein
VNRRGESCRHRRSVLPREGSDWPSALVRGASWAYANPSDYEQRPWWQQAGPTIVEPFPNDTTYFGNQTQSWMINFGVRDMDAMVAQLRAGGIEVTVDPETYPNGRFARLYDPEGNPVELWEPKSPEAT